MAREGVSKSIKHQQLSLFQKLSTTSHHLSNNEEKVFANNGLLEFWRVTVCPWVRRRLVASAPARNLPALDENGDAAGQSSHAAGCGVNTELLINKMPQPA